jgi:phospholipase C
LLERLITLFDQEAYASKGEIMSEPQNRIEHMVVFMLENRSFNHILD